MKKTIAFMMIIVLLSITPVFAKSTIENYLSAGTGVNFKMTSYDNDSDIAVKTTITSVPISASDYLFLDRNSNLGLYLDLGADIAITGKATIDGTESDASDLGYDNGKYPTYFDFTVGAAYRMGLGKTLELLMAAGFELSTKTSNQYEIAGLATGTYTETYYGLGINSNVVLSLSDNFKLLAGAKMGLWFANSNVFKATILGVEKSFKDTAKNYFSFSIAPKVALTYIL